MAIRLGLILALVMGTAAAPFAAGNDEKREEALARVDKAAEVFTEIMDVPEDGIPRDLLANAHCLAIVPGAKQAAFIFGAQYGVGVATCRTPGGDGWTAPSTVRIEGGSFGLQAGAGETDIVMAIMNEKGAEKLMSSRFTLGGEAEAMAGPVGRTVTAETDLYFGAEILSWSRSRGLFAGVSLKGATLRPDNSTNEALYGMEVEHKNLLKGEVPAQPWAHELIAALTEQSPVEREG